MRSEQAANARRVRALPEGLEQDSVGCGFFSLKKDQKGQKWMAGLVAGSRRLGVCMRRCMSIYRPHLSTYAQ